MIKLHVMVGGCFLCSLLPSYVVPLYALCILQCVLLLDAINTMNIYLFKKNELLKSNNENNIQVIFSFSFLGVPGYFYS